tara:strand:- start:11510 stop:12421 length:912 start_codon:yes stop_codon:yes gene_type:complete
MSLPIHPVKGVNGILLLDKPSGMSSNYALTAAKIALNVKKAGHTGSLDPLASGMLPLCFGEATKFARFLLESDKCYQVVAKLGETTPTGDSEGDILERKPVPQLTQSFLEEALKPFKGNISQVPPMYSALKHKGQPLYKLARQGKMVERPARDVCIHQLQLDAFSQTAKEATLSLTVECSKGTYIRTLVEDIGAALGCGAHVVVLRRLWVGSFKNLPMVTLDDFKAAPDLSHLLPAHFALNGHPEIILSQAQTNELKFGRLVELGHKANSGWVCLKDQFGDFIGVGEILSGDRLAPRRMMQTN